VSDLQSRSRTDGPVAAYVSGGTEPGTRALLEALPDVLLPVLLPDGDLDWARYDGALVPGRRGLLEPPGPRLGPAAVAACPVVVVPALSVDRRGTRLGRGGGSYDRALTRTTGRVLAALHDGELVARLPAEPHDRPVHAVVLPGRGLVRLRRHPDDDPPGAAATITG
jgi:5-formyltetrahydrofolate cyclo-ligase